MGPSVLIFSFEYFLISSDATVLAYNSALNEEKDSYPIVPEIEELVYAFISLALIVTEAEVA